MTGRTPSGGKSQNTGFSGPFGQGQPPWHLEKFRAKSRKTRFPGARGTFGGKKRPPKKLLPKSAQLFYILRFDGPAPQGREIVKYWVFRPFWPRAAPRHLEKFRAKNRKTQFPGARGTFGEKNRTPKKFLPKSAQLFYILYFDGPDPQGWEIAKNWVFGPFWPRAAPWHGTQRNSGLKTEKRDCPELGALLGGKNGRPKSFSQKARNF